MTSTKKRRTTSNRTNKNLDNLRFQQQEHNEWCWAAVAAMVAHFYDTTSTVTQCGVAAITTHNCCAQPLPVGCNVPVDLDSALTFVDRFHAPVLGPLTPGQLIRKTDAEKPVCARIGWAGGGGHFVVIKGYDNRDPQTLFLSISDPQRGEYNIPFETFRDRWTNSYYTG
jgi:ABC-type bacteriocin/lantibiotic exporter with double-glycine peptidase domain